MTNFNNNDYTAMIADLIHDAFYIDISTRGKIAKIRQYSEIILRKLLNIGSKENVDLGKIKFGKLKKISEEKLGIDRTSELIEIIEQIRPLGNDGTHTQHIEEFTDNELNQVINSLFDLYAFLFIEYFIKYPMTLDTQNEILTDFSLLPPIIRYKVLIYLYEKHSKNIQVVNRLVLAIIKNQDKATAYEWLEKHKKEINNIAYPNADEIDKYIRNHGIKIYDNTIIIYFKFPCFDNVYDLLIDKVNDTNTSINEGGKMYKEFEDSKVHYLNNKSKLTNPELLELHSIMDFVYIGRNADKGALK